MVWTTAVDSFFFFFLFFPFCPSIKKTLLFPDVSFFFLSTPVKAKMILFPLHAVSPAGENSGEQDPFLLGYFFFFFFFFSQREDLTVIHFLFLLHLSELKGGGGSSSFSEGFSSLFFFS